MVFFELAGGVLAGISAEMSPNWHSEVPYMADGIKIGNASWINAPAYFPNMLEKI